MPGGAIFQLICANCVIFRHKDDKGKLHKIDGPALIREYCNSSWYFHGHLIEKEQVIKHKKLIKVIDKVIISGKRNKELLDILDSMIYDESGYYKIRKDIVNNIIRKK